LENLPWFPGANSHKALDVLQRAVTVDNTYVHAHLNLAKLCIKRNQFAVAKENCFRFRKASKPHDSTHGTSDTSLEWFDSFSNLKENPGETIDGDLLDEYPPV